MRSWDEMEIFRGIDLLASFTRSWGHDGAALWFELLFALNVGHQFFLQPNVGESYSYKAGKLVFEEVESVSGLLPMRMVEPLVTPLGYYDFGMVEELEEEARGTYRISGVFGTATIRSAEPVIVYGMISV